MIGFARWPHVPLMAIVIASSACTSASSRNGFPAGVQFSRQPDGSLDKAVALLAHGDYALAIDEYRKALRDHPDDADALNGLAVSYDQLGRFDLSDRYFEEALAMAPREPAFYRNFARSLDRQGRSEDAANLRRDMTAMLAMNDAPAAPAAPADQGLAAAPMVVMAVPDPVPASRPLADLSITLPRISAPDTPAVMTASRRRPRLVRLSLNEVRLVVPAAAQPASVQRVDIGDLMAAPIAGVLPPRVVNAVGRKGIAGRFRHYLTAKGVKRLEVGDAQFRVSRTRVLFPPARKTEAERIASALPMPVAIKPYARADRVLVLIGADALAADDRLAAGRRS
jgi:hypothetical protein